MTLKATLITMTAALALTMGAHAVEKDYNGDGYSDILWQNTSGEVYIWEMNGTSVIGGGSLGNPGPSWHPIAK